MLQLSHWSSRLRVNTSKLSNQDNVSVTKWVSLDTEGTGNVRAQTSYQAKKKMFQLTQCRRYTLHNGMLSKLHAIFSLSRRVYPPYDIWTHCSLWSVFPATIGNWKNIRTVQRQSCEHQRD